jgi:uncharacterized membrane protein
MHKIVIDRVITCLFIFSIIATIAVIIYVAVVPKQGDKFTEFYILGPGGKAYDYPKNIIAGNRSMVIVGVGNQEYQTVNYTMCMILNNTPWDNATAKRIGDAYGKLYPVMCTDLTLAHNDTWQMPVQFMLNHTGDLQKLEFLLYRERNLTNSYRDLHLWVNVTSNESNSPEEDLFSECSPP